MTDMEGVKSCKLHNLAWEPNGTYAPEPHGEECPMCAWEARGSAGMKTEGDSQWLRTQ
jgi:hypothetical protein